MSTAEASYIAQRAESLAVVYLTRRSDLIVSRQQKEYGLDILVTISKDGKPSGRIFGVEVKASITLPKSGERKGAVNIPINISHINSIIELPFPVCIFFFTMENDKGYYKWLLKPDLSKQSSANLKRNTDNAFIKLTDSEMNKIVSQVSNWYDFRANEIAV